MTPTLTPSTGLLGTPAGELVLKVCGGEHDGRVLRLTAAKCLIGSAPGCTLRLRARGIRPVHALILRGPAGNVIRTWSPDTQLNERAFSEAVLELGDKIQIGPITLSVAEFSRETTRPRGLAPRSPDFPAIAPQSHLQSTIDTQREQLAAFELQIEKLQAAVQDATGDAREWAVALPIELPEETDRLNQQLAKTIEQLRKELDAAAKRRTMEQQTVARQRAAWEEQVQQRHLGELSRLREQLKTEQQEQQQTANAAKVKELEQQLAATEQLRCSLTRDVDSLKAALETRLKSEERGRQSTASQIEQLSEAYELVRQERDELFDRLHAEQQTFDGQSSNWQTQVDEARRQAQAQIAEAQTAAQVQVSQLRAEFARREQQFDEELMARTSNEGLRSATDAERIQKLTAELETLRSEAKSASSAQSQQQEGFTQARKRLEAEIATLNSRLKQSEQAVHEARANSGQLQSAVLAEAEQARVQRDSVREQMLRQQQDWTEFRSRLELAANEERDLSRTRYETLAAELAACQEQRTAARSEGELLQTQLHQLQIELEQSQEALFAAEHGVNQRLQQMTVSMENLQLDRSSEQSQLDQERSEWDQERNSLAQCVTELQHEVTRLTEDLQSAQQQLASAAQAQAVETDEQLQFAQAQLAEWQASAEQARQQAAELSQAVAKFRQQEQAWQLEREQLDQQQQTANERLQQLEASITDLQQQLDEARRAAAVTSPQPGDQQHQDFGSTVNVNNQDLAALREQANEPSSNLLAPRSIAVADEQHSADYQAREEAFQAREQELFAQQATLEEEQAVVARQRIELEQFQASLLELERSLTERAEQLLHPATAHDPNASYVSPDFHEHAYDAGPERESNLLSESEAFAAMADQVAALYRPEGENAPSLVHSPDDRGELSYDAPAQFAPPEEFQPAAEILAENVSSSVGEPADSTVDGSGPSEEDFDQQLEARIARVMRRERTDWRTPATQPVSENVVGNDSAEETPPPSQSQAVNSVLDRLKEAGLWKGEGTAKVDQLPSSSPPLDETGPGLCRLSQVGPIGADLADKIHEQEEVEEEPQDELELLSRPSPARSSLADSPAKEDESDDSIESYMSRLMQRLRSDDEPAPRPTNGGTPRAQAAAAKPVAAPPPPKPTDSKPLTSLSELSPRSQAPELSANLAAMRELANSAARGAIETHRTKNKQERVNLRTINSLMALLVAAGFTFLWSRTGSMLALGGISLSLLWAIGSSVVAALQALMLRQAKRDTATEATSEEKPATREEPRSK